MHVLLRAIKSEFVLVLTQKEFQCILSRDRDLYAVESYGDLLRTRLYDIQNLIGVQYEKNDGPNIYFTLLTSAISDVPTKIAEIEDIIKNYIKAEVDSLT